MMVYPKMMRRRKTLRSWILDEGEGSNFSVQEGTRIAHDKEEPPHVSIHRGINSVINNSEQR